MIDEINILQATFQAMAEALSQLKIKPTLVLVDGNMRIPQVHDLQETVVKGDAQSAVIAAASILAKVTRDRLMGEAHEKYPPYDFLNNKGYGTSSHQKALHQHGPCPIHRRTYAPIAKLLI
jgi:ribonuclease HII